MTQQRFPALPDYDGPKKGWFHAIHHADDIVEWSDNITERIDFINKNKLDSEIPIRLSNLMYVGDYQPACDYRAKRAPLDADYKARRALLTLYEARCVTLYADYEAKCAPYADYKAKCAPLDAEILIFVKQHNPDSVWVIGKGLNFGG